MSTNADQRDARLMQLAGALAPHQAKFSAIDDLYRRRAVLATSLMQIDDEIRQRMVDLYDGMTVQVIRSEIR